MTTIKYGVVEIESGEILDMENVEFDALMLTVRMNYKYDYKKYGVVKIKTTTTIEIEQAY